MFLSNDSQEKEGKNMSIKKYIKQNGKNEFW